MSLLALVLLAALLLTLPAWPYSASWGPYPSGVLGVALMVVLVLILMGAL
ncbi:Hypothetical protein RADP37_05289 [Roseomonas mucosa]|uniref:DUF3309 domain-containing protein n=1 Tax=Roseomonas mucosa TaxID=207340 RepID=A0A4Y1MUL2_9PROT|nr:DUF3309 family protein [Roseomonas mucosa]AWV21702.1 Hypothetical protein RADP37_05289 [Roseomonas mucosa]MDT8276690.1 DUF3309 family protein [Roseomonas mucosa]MDT8355262.1 DUF3309 family protein [Roseomonas mucosa]